MGNQQDQSPFCIFQRWYLDAEQSEPGNHNAMTLATANSNGQPSARIVLLKDWDENGFVFYTNLTSHKARDLAENEKAALLFYWKSLGKQIRIEGLVEQVSDAVADAYFKTRPRDSQLGAWASQQSAEMPDGRKQLEQALAQAEKRFSGKEVPRPPHWSGYRLLPQKMEFWEEGESRLHHRRLYTKRSKGHWDMRILFP